MLKILFIGDINGKIGRKTVQKILPKLKKDHKIDFVIANGENSSHGSGITEKTAEELISYGIDFITGGDHSFKQLKQTNIGQKYPVLRPANYSFAVPGRGYIEVEIKNNRLLIVNLIGRVFMKMNYDCPFKKIDEILAKLNLLKNKYSAIIIDIHAEATSEKISLKYYLDGRVSAVIGTHTHITTADEEITKKGTAYITDVGMTGYRDGCLGVDKNNIIKTFLEQIKYPHEIPEKGRTIFSSVLLSINPKTAKAESINPIVVKTQI